MALCLSDVILAAVLVLHLAKLVDLFAAVLWYQYRSQAYVEDITPEIRKLKTDQYDPMRAEAVMQKHKRPWQWGCAPFTLLLIRALTAFFAHLPPITKLVARMVLAKRYTLLLIRPLKTCPVTVREPSRTVPYRRVPQVVGSALTACCEKYRLIKKVVARIVRPKQREPLPADLARGTTTLFFDYHVLVLALCILTTINTNRLLSWLAIVFLLVFVWVQIYHLFIQRLRLGPTIFYFSNIPGVSVSRQQTLTELSRLTPWRVLEQALKIYCLFVLLVLIVYATIYTKLHFMYAASPSWAFCGVVEAQSPIGTFPQFLYFAIVTFATVGFGDIQPRAGALFLQMTVATQIIAGFLLVVLFLTLLAVSLTLKDDGHT